MHGLVVVDKEQQVLRNSIIWCDSRAVPYGDAAFASLGAQESLPSLLNSPGNFTASKLAWVKEKEPWVFEKVDRVMLPGDFIAMKLTGTITTTSSALSEGILWDFQQDALSEKVMVIFSLIKHCSPKCSRFFQSMGF
jgi:xylulokinase